MPVHHLTLHGLDWLIIAVYLSLALSVGFLVRKTAGRSNESYFLAGRSLPWWWLGTSMVATTFAADTPLARDKRQLVLVVLGSHLCHHDDLFFPHLAQESSANRCGIY